MINKPNIKSTFSLTLVTRCIAKCRISSLPFDASIVVVWLSRRGPAECPLACQAHFVHHNLVHDHVLVYFERVA